MARATNKLSDTRIRAAKPEKRAQKLFDGGGLFLLISPAGAKYWRLKYRFAGKEKLLALGVYPDMSLADARAARTWARELLAVRKDPALAKREEKRQQIMSAQTTFEAVAREWHERQAHGWTKNHREQVLSSLEHNVFPAIGSRPIAEISPAELLDVLRSIENRGALELAARVLQRCSAVFRYAISTARAKSNPATDLKGALRPPVKKHYAALDPKDLPTFLKCLDAFPGKKISELATRLLLLTFVRTGELRGARWEEFDLEAKLWKIPAERMKMRVEHLVPLSRQSIQVLDELREVSGHCELLFPNRGDNRKPMSANTVLRAIKRMGFQARTTAHGFRTLASTVLNEMGYDSDAIERQLAHSERNTVRAAYNRAKYLEKRRVLMQAWADYLDQARSTPAKNVVSLRGAAS